MLSLQDCLDYCDLTDDDVDLLAEHEHLPHDVAAHIACGLVQTPAGVVLIDHVMEDMIERAQTHGQLAKAEHVSHVYARFKAAHPLAH